MGIDVQLLSKVTIVFFNYIIIIAMKFKDFFSFQIWCDISEESKSFILQLLHTDPTVRLSARQALRHVWFTAIKRTYPKTSERSADQRSVRSGRSVGSSRSGGSSVQSLRVSGHRRVQIHHLEALSKDPEVAAML